MKPLPSRARPNASAVIVIMLMWRFQQPEFMIEVALISGPESWHDIAAAKAP